MEIKSSRNAEPKLINNVKISVFNYTYCFKEWYAVNVNASEYFITSSWHALTSFIGEAGTDLAFKKIHACKVPMFPGDCVS